MNAPALKPGDCHVWWADPEVQPMETLLSTLNASELERAASYRREADRRRNLTASWLLREVAGAQLGIAPEKVPIERRCGNAKCDKLHGRPHILTDDGLHASISHSGGRVAVALTTAGPVGVDVEEVPTTPVAELVRCALSQAEQAVLASIPEHEQQAGFARMWTCKEAVLKATGHGLRIPPDKVEVSGPREEPALLSWPLDIAPETVRITTLYPGDGYTGVVSILVDDIPITVSEWTATSLGRNSFSLAAPIAA
ncbi:4'-phosphopantetheinyl transferase family protein [Sphaerisporangium corydalis]|uniref:4'-phosphopantetheinyl transferase family protein n=1 Tax=Sphaerisporangium corydalis TaxID=1441875 RepID=A0ABV9EBN4_9ACTN|nr:4'-phosphopantetheinyl transferase superfamily protein [Sphaerisporangium corydalis]